MDADYIRQIKVNNIIQRLQRAQEAMRYASSALRKSEMDSAMARGLELSSAAGMIDEWITEIKKGN